MLFYAYNISLSHATKTNPTKVTSLLSIEFVLTRMQDVEVKRTIKILD